MTHAHDAASSILFNRLAHALRALAIAAISLGELAFSPSAARSAEPAPKPNIVVILIDDLGWADSGCYGSQYYETPNVDRLASQGLRFTNAYAACAVCSPTRASIMTGKHPARLHLTDWIPGEGDSATHRLLVPKWRQFLPLEETSIAQALRSAGYVSASIGKWHLGGPQYSPERHGFDLNVAGGHIGHPASYFWPYEGKTHTVPGLKQGGHEGEYLTDRLTEEAEKFIAANKEKPFFLYLSHYAVHTPLQAKPGTPAKFKAKQPSGAQNNATYAAMIESVDESLGRILSQLQSLGIDDRTLVLFTSDNGGLWPAATSNVPLRAGKAYPYEGGIRAPLVVRWPGKIPAGGVSHMPVSSIDIFPTLLEIAGLDPRGDVDGKSLAPLLLQNGSFERDALYWHYPHYWGGDRVRPYGAIRAGDWKLIEFYEDMRVELYNLRDDLAETHDLSTERPEKAQELRDRLHRWRESVEAQMPTANANYVPTMPKP